MNIAQSPRFSRRFRRFAILGALVVLGFAFHSHYTLAIVSGTSMLPTLKPGDVLLVDKRAYKRIEPDRGDIIVAKYSGEVVVKRVVGLPSEEVEVRNGRLYINNRLMQENYPTGQGTLYVEKGNLLEGDFATLGDNRAVSPALAIHPIVTKADILGKVVLALGRRKTGPGPHPSKGPAGASDDSAPG